MKVGKGFFGDLLEILAGSEYTLFPSSTGLLLPSIETRVGFEANVVGFLDREDNLFQEEDAASFQDGLEC